LAAISSRGGTRRARSSTSLIASAIFTATMVTSCVRRVARFDLS
jgi:hypothetical protein